MMKNRQIAVAVALIAITAMMGAPSSAVEAAEKVHRATKPYW